jgi:hypothetical protein
VDDKTATYGDESLNHLEKEVQLRQVSLQELLGPMTGEEVDMYFVQTAFPNAQVDVKRLKRSLSEKIDRHFLGEFAPPLPYEARLERKRQSSKTMPSNQRLFSPTRRVRILSRSRSGVIPDPVCLAQYKPPQVDHSNLMCELFEQSTWRKRALEEQAYAELLLSRGCSGDFVLAAIDAWDSDPNHDLLVSREELELRVVGLRRESIRRAVAGSDDEAC